MLARMLGSVAVVSSIAGLAFGCSGSDESATISPEAACEDAARALCAKIDECAPFFVKIAFGDRATCEARGKIDCVPTFSANGTSATPARLSQCAQEAAAMACEDVLGRKTPPSCRTEPGTLADGAACGDDAQCKGTLCRLSSSNVCGACSSLGAAGAACERDEDCGDELACADKKCVAFAKAGAPCSATQPCLRSLACSAGVCAAPLAAGVACTPALDGSNPCDGAKGLYCNAGTKVCTSIGSSPAGGPCGFVDGGFTVCTGGADCKVAPPSVSGTCQAPAADGAACNETTGPKCLAPARCVGGVCTITDATSCK